jgi:hypothetical protein
MIKLVIGISFRLNQKLEPCELRIKVTVYFRTFTITPRVMRKLFYSFLYFITFSCITRAGYVNSPSSENDHLIVDLGYAKYQGVRNETSSNVRFLGVRYAKSPAGEFFKHLMLQYF